ncbi:MAG: molybdate ABC transporter substrate-binding protein [Actinomycetota bacterium]|nr:molybdate ABC transporter substrate-binding protein [Actinomycetota bacterium]
MKNRENFRSRWRAGRLLLLASIILVSSALSGCGSGSQPLRVFVASSFAGVVDRIVAEHVRLHPDTDVELNVASSGTLMTQLKEGADADVVILASESYMGQLAESGLVRRPRIVALNSLGIAVSPSLAGQVTSMDEIRDSDLQIAICVESAPCGVLALAYASSIGLDLASATREPNVRAVLAKVERDEVDVGFVYASDLRSSTADLGRLMESGAERHTTSYSLAVATNSTRAQEARDFASLFESETGSDVMVHFGFELP